tara:strand:- start:234 stop:605 length:372 start_codon:yes stop_codon:yes gene_type:complete
MDSSKYFSKAELQCKCGCEQAPMDPQFLMMLDELRSKLNKPLRVSSGFRCPSHNSKVSGTGETGPHTTGKAIDLAVDRSFAYETLRASMAMGFTGIGVKQKGGGRFLHLDTITEGLRPTIWSY